MSLDDKLNNNIFNDIITDKFEFNIGDKIDVNNVIIGDTDPKPIDQISVSPQNMIHHDVNSVYTQPIQLKNLPTISTLSSTSLEYLTSLTTSKSSSGTLSSSSSSTNTTSVQPQILSKVDITQCHFVYENCSTIINAKYQGDLAFLYKVGDDLNLNGGGEISCCLNGMSDEISIPFNQLSGFKILNEKKITIKFKLDFRRTYRHHLGGYPYLLDPTILHTDPSDGKFNSLRSLILIPYDSEDSSILEKIENDIEKLWFKQNGVRNELAKDNRQKLYLTCVFPTERRAIAVPMDSTYQKLLIILETRFNMTMDNLILRYRNKRGDIVVLKGDNCWETAKNEATGKNLTRLELHICMAEEFHLLKQDKNNLKTQVCLIENFYEVICAVYQATEHGGQEKI
ncbi:5187_t:CDS:2 [Scutellospora calospora]|uniref:5187_t:CDS:1 n=1 Tax=Scutellospora calospora TaxID=85575 RepID=A0ACA9K1C9_9GLOM|nr:5187_t:CDS:2 [Scutellospora calospora]